MIKSGRYEINHQLYALEKIKAWGGYGEGVKIGVLDSHIKRGESVNDAANVQKCKSREKEEAIMLHGTIVSDIISNKKTGISPKATIISIPIFNEIVQGNFVSCSELKLAQSIKQARAAGCHIINISGSSLSHTGHGTDELVNEINQCVEKNILIIAAIGNNGAKLESIPASLEGVIAVGAHNISGKPASFNNHGSIMSKDVVLSPGVDVSVDLGNTYSFKVSGTSFSTPVISGICALIINIARKARADYVANDIEDLLLDSCAYFDSTGSELDRPKKILDITELCKKVGEKYFSITPSSMQHIERSTPMNEKTENQAAHEAAVIQSADTAGSEPVNSEIVLPTVSDNASKEFVHIPVQDTNPIMPANTGAIENIEKKVFAIGEIGYDFITEANRDYFQQAMYNSKVEGSRLPGDELYMAKFLSYRENGNQPHMDSSTALTWLLKVDGIPIYAIRPQDAFAIFEFGYLASFLMGKYGIDESKIHSLDTNELSRAMSDVNSYDKDKIERVSIAGSIVDEIRLYNGQFVPVVSPVLRGMSAWKTEELAKHVLPQKASADQKNNLMNFLDRIYYELRNRGATSKERAINYAATNAYQAGEIFKEVLKENNNYSLNKISAEKSPVNRPGSDCWDVVLEFFDPDNRMKKARKIYRYTIDVSEVMPVTFGKLRHWYAY